MRLFIRLGFIVADVVLLNAAILLSYTLFGVEILGPDRSNTIYLIIFSNLSWLFLLITANPYNVTVAWGIQKIIRSQLSFVLIHVLVLGGLIVLLRKDYHPQQIATIYLIFIPAFFLTKFLAFYGTSFFSRSGSELVKYIIIGRHDLAVEIRKHFFLHSKMSYRYCGLLEPSGVHWSIERIKESCEANKIDMIFCCLPEMTNTDIRRLVEFGMDSMIQVKLISDHRSFHNRALALEQYDEVPVFDIHTIPLDDWRNQWLKRTFDICFSVMVSIFILSWLIPVIGALIKLESAGPVFFRQLRV
jgi:FlaA1/EpsC-like NDP-sugar epimerase